MDKRSLKQPKGLAQGIYFNLSNEAYHKDKSLSHSGIVKLLSHHYDYWLAGPLNETRERKEPTPGMRFGTRCHMYLLQRSEFIKTYRTMFDTPVDPTKELLSPQEYRDIKESIALLGPIIKKYITDGYPEVTIIWIDPETGIRCRARVDWLRTFGGLDYKRCMEIEDEKLGWHIAKWGYDLQDEWYCQGINQLKTLIRNKFPITIQGDYDPKWLARFAFDPDTEFKFIFQRSVAPYVYKDIDFDDEINALARTSIELAKETYLNALDTFGTAKPWPAGEDKTKVFTPFNLPNYIQKRGIKSL